VERVLVVRGAGGSRIQEIIDLCRDRKVALRFEERHTLDKLAKGATHQGVVALGAAQQYAGLSDLPKESRMVVALDGIEDPHNLGAVIRTVNAAGADAVMLSERRAAGLTEVVERTAAGALAYVRVIRVSNLSQGLERLKKSGYWIYGLDERGEQAYDEVEYLEPSVLVFGAEGRGLHQHVRNRCDVLVRIPMSGQIASLNVSVAAGVTLFEWRRRSGREK
jgi:23S rRNA (guanosine2251-2'-O)-methyltransferase